MGRKSATSLCAHAYDFGLPESTLHTMSTSHSEPVTGFACFDLGVAVQRGVTAAGFVEPRPIQIHTIPAALEGRDILGLAQTGTGKTAAFALPVIERLRAIRKPGPRVLIVAPTRELARQISDDIRTLARFTHMQTVAIFGGVSARPQITALRTKPEIIVACPGRLLDLLQQGAVTLHRIETLVLDEADHMFDMGFLPDVRRILSVLPKDRQNLLFAATMPQEIRELADQLLQSPHVVDLNHSRPASTIEHALYPIEGHQKFDLLEHVFAEDEFVSAIVFTRTKHRARRLAQQLSRSGRRAVALQGNMSQNQRDRAMDGFRRQQFDILVATDIAARGLDVEQVSHVVNFDMPNTPDAYTHRIGRTGRAERKGKAYTFVTADDHALVHALERKFGVAIPHRTIDVTNSIPHTTGRSGNDRPARPSSRIGSATHDQNRPSRARPQRGAGSREQGKDGTSRDSSRRRRSRRPGLSRISWDCVP
jgi:ATP-dependent RNA helicase RhlE